MPIGGTITAGGSAGGGASSSWTERYLVDWSAEAAHDWDANAAVFDIQGAGWGAVGMANASQSEIVPGSGLEMSPDAATASEWFSAQSCPRIYAKLVDWAPNAGLYPNAGDLQAICFQALIAGNVTQDDNGYGLGITSSTGPTVSIGRLYSSSVWPAGTNSGYRVSASYNGGPSWAATNSSEDGTTYELFEIVIFPGSLAVASIRNETEMVDPMGPAVFQKQISVNQYNGTDETQNSWLPSDFWPQFYSYNGSTTTHTAKVKAFRVLSLGEE